MDLKRSLLIVLLMISVSLLSSCEVYQTLYGTPTQTTGEVIAPPQDEEPSQPIIIDETPVGEIPPIEIVQGEPEEPVVPIEVEKSSEKPVVIVVQETDLVNLIPKAEDPDKEAQLTFTFTSPVSDQGEWQTKYGDAGEYTVTVTVSDGEAATSRDVLILVNKKEETPTIDSAKPIETGLTIDEGQSVDFYIVAADLNNDPLTYSWKFDGNDDGDATDYTYQSDYDSAGTHTVKAEVSDGLSIATRIWSVDVRNVNREPVLEPIDDITVRETEKVVITALATDDDKDTITYSISDEMFRQEDNVFSWETDYNSAGTYEFIIAASDGTDSAERTFSIVVENVNRPPVIVDVLQK